MTRLQQCLALLVQHTAGPTACAGRCCHTSFTAVACLQETGLLSWYTPQLRGMLKYVVKLQLNGNSLEGSTPCVMMLYSCEQLASAGPSSSSSCSRCKYCCSNGGSGKALPALKHSWKVLRAVEI